METRTCRVVGHPDVGAALLQLIKCSRLGRPGIRRCQYSKTATRGAMSAQGWHQRRDAAAADKGHDYVNAIRGINFCKYLVADTRFSRCVGEKCRI